MSVELDQDASNSQLSNRQIAALLEEIAERLDGQGANPFRVQAYRTAGATMRRCSREAVDILREEGSFGLTKLAGIGTSLARSIEQLAWTGELPLLSRLRGDANVERLFESVAGIGPQLAERIHDQLHIETLADLEMAAHDGRLEKIDGIGIGRVRAVKESLAGRFARTGAHRWHALREDEPSVAELLDIDEEYRRKADADRLIRIAPRRFNPTGAAWLPILHTHRGDRHYTALFSNTARAHQMHRTHDWVVIYRDDHQGDGQWTVITAKYGPLRSKRIVRGREDECRSYYSESFMSESPMSNKASVR